ncbi:phage major capsid protein [Lentilactobacillus kefiri]|uniref:phage major capsid protein n=1 Tax=Lentilactobacillus kefiri TaxID=33962 RepID=UPI002072B118|nr:phage major capsid protein [Lentilactobacillus kefiri]
MTKIQNDEKLILKATNIRALQDDDKDTTTIQGDAIVYGQPSQPMDNFTEIVDSGALDNVDFSNTFLLLDHDYSKVIAKNGVNMTLTNNASSLHFTAVLDTSISYVSDVYNLINQGIINSMSFGFTLPDDGSGEQWSEDDNGNVVRLITQIDQLFEISVVTIPAYSETDVEVATRSYEKFIAENKQNKDAEKRSKEENKHMTEKTIIKPENEKTQAQKEVRSFEDYIRSEGETRDGLTTDGNGVLIPSEVVTPIFQSKKNSNRLSDYATVKQVSVGQGSYPIAGNDPSKVLATKAENAAIGDVDPEVTGVEFKTQTRAGKVYLSQELVDDNAINFSSEIQAQMQKLVDNTDNAQILAKLKTLSPVVVKSVDAIKQAKNTKLDPSLQPVVVVNQSAFNWLDTQKDSQGRYLMSDDIQAPTGRSLFGLQVVELSDAQLPNVDTGKFPMYVSDLASTIAIFRRNQVTTKWTQFDSYSQGLAIMLRNDYQFIDKTATVALTIDTTPGK